MANGFYASGDDLVRRFGLDTLTQWSDLDGSGAIDDARVQAALDWADAQIDSRFMAGGVFSISPGSHLSLGPISTILCREWACVIAGVWLYEVRSGRDERYIGNLRPQLDEARAQLHLAAADTKNSMGFDAQRKWPQTNAAIGFRPNEIAALSRNARYQ